MDIKPLLIRRLYRTLKNKKIKKQNGKFLVSTCPLQGILEQSTKDGSHSHDGHVSNVGHGSSIGGRSRSRRRRAAAAGRSARGSILGGRVGLSAGALVATGDDMLIAQRLVRVAGEVASALHVKATLNVFEGWKGDTADSISIERIIKKGVKLTARIHH